MKKSGGKPMPINLEEEKGGNLSGFGIPGNLFYLKKKKGKKRKEIGKKEGYLYPLHFNDCDKINFR